MAEADTDPLELAPVDDLLEAFPWDLPDGRRRALLVHAFACAAAALHEAGLVEEPTITLRSNAEIPQTIRRGDAGPVVALWQRVISRDEFPTKQLAVDGRFGAATERATIRWQFESGLAPDGVVGPKTWNAAELEPIVFSFQVVGGGSEHLKAALRALAELEEQETR